MHILRGHGAGPIRAALLAVLACTLMLGGTPALGSHLLEAEGRTAAAEKPTRTLVVALPTDTILVGDRIRADVLICGAGVTDISECDPARKAKVTTRPKGVLEPSKGRGYQVLFTANKPGAATITGKQSGLTGTATLKVNEPPDLTRGAPPAGELRLRILPSEQSLRIGQIGTFSAWGCPSGVTLSEEENAIAHGCLPATITALNKDPGTPVDVYGPFGNAFGALVTQFPADVSGDRAFVGIQVVTDVGSTLPSIEAVDAPFEGPVLTDQDLDGGVDLDDLSTTVLGSPIPLGHPDYSARRDLNRDWIIDSADGEFWLVLTPGAVPDLPADGGLIQGDLDGDDAVTVTDYFLWRNETRDIPMPLNMAESLLDVNRDGRVTDADGTWLAQTAFIHSGRLRGDVDGDGEITGGDADAIFGTFLMGRYDPVADFDGDGVLDESDWMALAERIGGDPDGLGAAPTPPARQ